MSKSDFLSSHSSPASTTSMALALLLVNALLFRHEVNAVALTGATPTARKKEINRQLMALAERRLQPGEDEIKLCYVTVCVHSVLL
jgi:hypothetical protein